MGPFASFVAEEDTLMQETNLFPQILKVIGGGSEFGTLLSASLPSGSRLPVKRE